MNKKKLVFSLGASGLLGTAVISGVMAASVWAQSQPNCVGSGCNGGDPFSSKCGEDAKTIGENSTTYWDGIWRYTLRVQLRYSPRCQAGWVIADRVMRNSQLSLRDASDPDDPNGGKNLITTTANVNGQVRGDMWERQGYRACVSLPSGQSRPGIFCTSAVPNPS